MEVKEELSEIPCRREAFFCNGQIESYIP